MKRKKEIDLGALIEEEYTAHNDTEDDEVYLIKEALKNALNSLERKIYISYLENGTYAATAKAFKVSIPTLSKYIGGLREKIIKYVDSHI